MRRSGGCDFSVPAGPFFFIVKMLQCVIKYSVEQFRKNFAFGKL